MARLNFALKLTMIPVELTRVHVMNSDQQHTVLLIDQLTSHPFVNGTVHDH